MKSQFQDIIPPEKRSIRNIPLSNHDKSDTNNDLDLSADNTIIKEARSEPVVSTDEVKPLEKKISFFTEPKSEVLIYSGDNSVRGMSKIILWSLTIFMVFVLFFSVTYFLHSAQIILETKKVNLNMPNKLNMSITGAESTVKYSTISYSDLIKSEIKSSGEKDSLEKAKGTIVIYNNYDSNNQKLTIGTRFETKSGLIYKLIEPVVVPGVKLISGKPTPGSIEVVVEAEKAGSEYNIGLEDFTIPGLKNDPRYEKFYARSKTPMTGGNIGKVPIILEADMNTKTKELQEKISTKLKDRLKKEIPSDQVLFDKLVSIEYKPSKSLFENGKPFIEVSATVKAYVIDQNSLSKNLLSLNGLRFDDDQRFKVDIRSIKDIEIIGTTSPSLVSSGSLGIEYIVELDSFRNKLANVSVPQVLDIAKSNDAISSIKTTVKPFWKKVTPNNLEKIEVLVN